MLCRMVDGGEGEDEEEAPASKAGEEDEVEASTSVRPRERCSAMSHGGREAWPQRRSTHSTRSSGADNPMHGNRAQPQPPTQLQPARPQQSQRQKQAIHHRVVDR